MRELKSESAARAPYRGTANKHGKIMHLTFDQPMLIVNRHRLNVVIAMYYRALVMRGFPFGDFV